MQREMEAALLQLCCSSVAALLQREERRRLFLLEILVHFTGFTSTRVQLLTPEGLAGGARGDAAAAGGAGAGEGDMLTYADVC
jgi:hypothetical protein